MYNGVVAVQKYIKWGGGGGGGGGRLMYSVKLHWLACVQNRGQCMGLSCLAKKDARV